jgi:ApaG protein
VLQPASNLLLKTRSVFCHSYQERLSLGLIFQRTQKMTAENPHNITVEVETSYVEGQSEPDNERYVFSYTITIRNEGGEPAQLLSRHWIITDANGNIQEVKGEGVVGEQPHLKPGEGFQYTSGAMITTPVGSMRGSYQMIADSGEQFDAEIPAFTLAIPRTLH